MHGISERTLRLWISRYAANVTVDAAQLGEIVRRAIHSLEAALRAIEATTSRAPEDPPAHGTSVPLGKLPNGSSPRHRSRHEGGRQIPSSGFDWDFAPAG